MPTSEEEAREIRNARAIQGICIDCGEKEHSAGRPRCDECHSKRVVVIEPGLRRQPNRRRGWR